MKMLAQCVEQRGPRIEFEFARLPINLERDFHESRRRRFRRGTLRPVSARQYGDRGNRTARNQEFAARQLEFPAVDEFSSVDFEIFRFFHVSSFSRCLGFSTI